MITPERIEELNAKLEKCPHGLYGVCHFCDQHARKVQICGWGALAWIIASLLALCAFAVVSCNAAGITDSRFLDALALIESGNNPQAVGGAGELGAYQMTKAAWKQAEHYGHPAISGGFEFAHDPAISRYYARIYCDWLEVGLRRTLRRKPTIGEIYCAYNLGPSGFSRLGHKIKNCPTSTRLAAAKMERLMR